MKISRYNSEGYYDPTAYDALNNISTLVIKYPTGYMELKMDRFFPCTVNKANKLFSLFSKYASKEDKNRLITYLKELVQEYELQIEENIAKANKYPFTSKEAKRYITKFKKAQTLKRRAIRNIEIFSKVEELT